MIQLKPLLRFIAIILFALVLSGSADAQEIGAPSTIQDVYLSFNFSNLVNTIITAKYYNDSVYLPIGAIFKQLRINYIIDPQKKTISGFFIKPSNKYDIDFAKRISHFDGRETTIDSSIFLVAGLEFYLTPVAFKKIFNLDFTVDMNNLSLYLQTEQKLPVVEDYERSVQRQFLTMGPNPLIQQAPLRFPRHRALFDGGVIDYSLTGYRNAGQNSFSYGFDAGAELLGGDLEGSISGTYSGQKSLIYAQDIHWRYVVDSSRYVTALSLGNLSSNGLNQYGFRGIQITNIPVYLRTVFGNYAFNVKTNPNWDVELYQNGQLIGYSKADAFGNVRFSIPLVYGSSFLDMKIYGPSGEFREEERRIQIPYSFLPHGEVNYAINIGKLNSVNNDLIQANVAVGLTDWLTNKVGIDYLNSPFYNKPIAYNSLSLRIGTSYLLNFDAAPAYLYRAVFSGLYPSLANFDISYASYRENQLYNPGQLMRSSQVDGYIPFAFAGGNFGIRANGSMQEYLSGAKTYSYSADANFGVASMNISIGYLGSHLDYGAGSATTGSTINVGLLYSLFFSHGFFSFLNGSLASTFLRYNLQSKAVDNIQFQFSRSIFSYFRFQLTAQRDFFNNLTTFGAQIIADLPWTRSTTMAQSQSNQYFYSQNFSGSIGFDSYYHQLLLTELGWVGNSAATFRSFVDENGNGRYDKGEEIIKDAPVTLRQASYTQQYSTGLVRDWNLLPYTRYSADVQASVVRNPLWIPELTSFSFVTDPNVYKPIDVPFFVGGVVDGMVVASDRGTENVIPGLSLEIKSSTGQFNKSIAVFSDGSFYYMGLPPGGYVAYIDSSQLSILNMVSQPQLLSFVIKPTKQGDYVSGLKIKLIPKQGFLRGEQVTPAESLATGSEVAGKSVHRQIVPARYFVQVGAFTSMEKAQKFAERIDENIPYKLHISHDKFSGLYIVHLDTVSSKIVAFEQLGKMIYAYRINDAFIAGAPPIGIKRMFRIQLGAFGAFSDARKFADDALGQIRQIKGMERTTIDISFKRAAGMFSVQCCDFPERSTAEFYLSKLRQIRIFKNAFVVLGIAEPLEKFKAVQIGAYGDFKLAQSFAKRVYDQTGLVSLVSFDNIKGEFRVFTLPDSTSADFLKSFEKFKAMFSDKKLQEITVPF
ncbi:MAG: hypothetical protein ACP5MI_06165 [Candidatus Kryptoniota bacterium]